VLLCQSRVGQTDLGTLTVDVMDSNSIMAIRQATDKDGTGLTTGADDIDLYLLKQSLDGGPRWNGSCGSEVRRGSELVPTDGWLTKERATSTVDTDPAESGFESDDYD
jgi:hypothetical protein